EFFNGGGKPLSGDLTVGSPLQVRIAFELPHPTAKFDARINFLDLYGQVIFAARSSYEPQRNWGERRGLQRMVCEIPVLPLTPGEYRIDVGLVVEDRLVVDYVDDVYRLKVAEADFYGSGNIPSYGFIVQPHRWRLE